MTAERCCRPYPRTAVAAVMVVLLTGLAAAPASAADVRVRPSTSVGSADHQPRGRHVTVNLGADGRISAPSALRAGRYTFGVRGMGWAQLSRPVRGYTAAEFARDWKLAGEYGDEAALDRTIRLTRLAGGTTNLVSGKTSSFTTTLHPGTYWLLNVTDETSAPRMVTIKVTGRAPASVFPRVAGIITARDRHWSVPATLPASAEVLVSNRSKTLQMVFIFPASSGLDPVRHQRRAQALRAKAAEEGVGVLLPGGEGVAMSGIVAPGTSFVWKYRLPAGKYVVVTDPSMDNEDAVRPITLR